MHPDSFSKLRQPTGQRLSNVRMQQTKISIGPILFLHYQESLVQSSNLNSKQLRCHGAHPNVSTYVRNAALHYNLLENMKKTMQDL